MEKVINIRWETGRMTIYLPEFFPAAASKINQLLKVIRLDYNHCDDLIKEILEYLHSEIPRCKYDKECAALVWDKSHQLAVDYTQMVNSRKKPSGVMLTKDELEEARSNRDYYKREEAERKKEILSYQRRIEKVQKNIELIEKKTNVKVGE